MKDLFFFSDENIILVDEFMLSSIKKKQYKTDASVVEVFASVFD